MPKSYDPFSVPLPSDPDSERLILGNVILDSSRMPLLRDVLFTEDFSNPQNSIIWKRMVVMFDAGVAIDHVTLASHLAGAKELESCGGLSYLSDLDTGMPIFPNLDAWVEIIRKKSVKRQAIIKCNDIMIRLAGTDEDASEVFMDASAKMSEFNSDLLGDTGFSTPFDIVTKAGGTEKYLDSRRAEGIQTPWGSLNRMTGGFRPQELIVIAAHTARGKTAMALNIALHAASRNLIPVAIFSMEMSEDAINDRFISIGGRIDGRTLRRREARPELEAIRIAEVGASLRHVVGLPLYISDTTTVTVPAMEGRLRRLMSQVPIGLVIVDYIQLASGVGRSGSRAEEVGSISRALKRMASSLKVPVIALSQFNRDSARDNREPEKWDLKESGSIEQDANLILAIHFTAMYDVMAGIPEGEVKLKVLKQRNGPEGWLPMKFHAPSGEFREVDPHYYAEPGR